MKLWILRINDRPKIATVIRMKSEWQDNADKEKGNRGKLPTDGPAVTLAGSATQKKKHRKRERGREGGGTNR